MTFLYQPYGIEHSWQNRMHHYLEQPSGRRAPEDQLTWLRQQWKENKAIKAKLLCIAKQIKIYGAWNGWKSYLPTIPCDLHVVQEAVHGIINKGLV